MMEIHSVHCLDQLINMVCGRTGQYHIWREISIEVLSRPLLPHILQELVLLFSIWSAYVILPVELLCGSSET